MNKIEYKKKSKIFTVRNSYLSVIPKPLAEMLELNTTDQLIWRFDGNTITVEVAKGKEDGKTAESSN